MLKIQKRLWKSVPNMRRKELGISSLSLFVQLWLTVSSSPNFFIAYLIAIAVFGLFQAIYMANAGGAWDNAKKVVEVDLKEKNTPLHEAAVVGDTIGDPFKDTTSVSLNPIIKFSTLFGLLGIEIAVSLSTVKNGVTSYDSIHWVIADCSICNCSNFYICSFYGMRIKK